MGSWDCIRLTALGALLIAAMLPARAQNWAEFGFGSATNGGVSNNSTASECSSLAFDFDGSPYLAWHDDNLRRLHVAGYGDGGWQKLGTGVTAPDGGGDAVSCWPSLACAPNGSVAVAWVEESATLVFRIFVRRWNGTAWTSVGSGSASGDGISGPNGWALHPVLAVDAEEQWVVAWQNDRTGLEEIYVRRWNGADWAEVGMGSASGGGVSATVNGRSLRPAIACAKDGQIAVAWCDDSSGRPEVYLRNWNGSDWQELGGSASNGGLSNTGSVRANTRPGVVFDANGNPLVAWVDGAAGAGRVYARRWDGEAWAEIGLASASGEGVSAHGGDVGAVSLGATPEGQPVLAWEAAPQAPTRIYVRSWDGMKWSGLGAGSDSGSGISASSRPSRRPALAVNPRSGQPSVAWDGTLEHPNTEIYIRQYTPPLPVYTVVFELGVHGIYTGGGALEQQIEHGSTAVSPEFSVTPGWAFVGWQPEVPEIIDANFTATAHYRDSQKPVISVAPEMVTMGSTDPVPELMAGVTAMDNGDGDITAGIVVSGIVDPAVPGQYVIRYNVADAAGNQADEKSRTYVVVPADTAPWMITIHTNGGAAPLVIGMAEGAGNGVDIDHDIEFTPDSTPAAWLAGVSESTRLQADFRAIAGEAEYLILVQAAAGADTILSWNASGLPDGRYLSLWEVDESSYTGTAGPTLPPLGGTSVDMGQCQSLSVTPGQTHAYVVRYAPDLTVDWRLEPGWNLKSLPLRPHIPTVNAVLAGEAMAAEIGSGGCNQPGISDIGGQAWHWNGHNYQLAEVFKPGNGYWLYSDGTAKVLLVRGLPAIQPENILSHGWNLVGACCTASQASFTDTGLSYWHWRADTKTFEVSPVSTPHAGYFVYAPFLRSRSSCSE